MLHCFHTAIPRNIGPAMTNKTLKKKGICLKTKVGHLNIISPRAGVQRRNRYRHQKHSKYVLLKKNPKTYWFYYLFDFKELCYK